MNHNFYKFVFMILKVGPWNFTGKFQQKLLTNFKNLAFCTYSYFCHIHVDKIMIKKINHLYLARKNPNIFN
jgi:hypothetical protein